MQTAEQWHIITVGISLLTNFERQNNLARTVSIRKIAQLDEFLAANPRLASAEINALLGLLGSEHELGRNVGVSLVSTQTAESKVCAGALKRYLSKKGVLITELKIRGVELPATGGEDLNVRKKIAESGLREFRDKVNEHVVKLRARDPHLKIFFNATGGFKAEIAVLYGLGKTLGIPTYYLHETYKCVIDLP